ncbi:Cubilin [Armadillidium vulgare]|nr:Cubilin [Armadillidium vulgare]
MRRRRRRRRRRRIFKGIPGCGGLLSSDVGEFSPPSLSEEYQVNTQCEWKIRVPPGEKIELNFTRFHIEHHASCIYDFVEVRDGGERDTCGGEYTAASGVLTSPYFPKNYPHNRICYYTIYQLPGKAILLNFTSFDLEDSHWIDCHFDYLIIRDGLSPSSPLFGKYCGPDHRVTNPIVSSLNALYLEFRTDGSVSNKGFSATYSTIDIGCGGIHRTLSGTINSPSSPESYPGNTDCRWVIDLPPQYVIQLTWNSFSLENHFSCRFDYVEIFDNSSVPSLGGRMGSKYCGTSILPVMTSTGNIMTIHFHSDQSINHDGFSATYHALHADRVCGGHYHMSSGRITSPNYPLNYPDTKTCSWTITVPVNHQIRLNFTYFDMEGPEPRCPHDHLIIRKRDEITGETTTASSCNYYAILCSNYQLYSLFLGCGGTLTSPTGELSSPGYPQPYHRHASCIWKINVNKGSKILFSFIDLDFPNSRTCYTNFVEYHLFIVIW